MGWGDTHGEMLAEPSRKVCGKLPVDSLEQTLGQLRRNADCSARNMSADLKCGIHPIWSTHGQGDEEQAIWSRSAFWTRFLRNVTTQGHVAFRFTKSIANNWKLRSAPAGFLQEGLNLYWCLYPEQGNRGMLARPSRDGTRSGWEN